MNLAEVVEGVFLAGEDKVIECNESQKKISESQTEGAQDKYENAVSKHIPSTLTFPSGHFI